MRRPVTWDLLLWALTVLGLLAFSTAIAAIVLAVRFRGHVRASRVWDRSAFLPEVVAFVDSDIRPDPGFLRALVQPLALPSIGGTTGYRWYVPVRGGLWSVVRSAWNAAGLNIFFSDRYNFLWGGAWAIRRENLDRLDLEALWRGTLSEDLASTAGLKRLGLRVQFVP